MSVAGGPEHGLPVGGRIRQGLFLLRGDWIQATLRRHVARSTRRSNIEPHHLLRTFIERQWDYSRGCLSPTDFDFDAPANVRTIRGHVCHPDVLLKIGSWGAARDLAGRFAVEPNRITIARRGTVDHFESDELLCRSLRPLPQQGVPAQKVSLFEFRDPTQVSFEQRGLFIQFVAVKRVSRFQPQRVARAEPAGISPSARPASNSVFQRFAEEAGGK